MLDEFGAAAPLLAQVTGKGHRIGPADEKNFEYGLECILDHASRLIDEGKKAASNNRRRSKRASGK